MMRGMGRPNPHQYDEYLKAYSVAMLPGRERENVSYGGKSTQHLLKIIVHLTKGIYIQSLCRLPLWRI